MPSVSQLVYLQASCTSVDNENPVEIISADCPRFMQEEAVVVEAREMWRQAQASRLSMRDSQTIAMRMWERCYNCAVPSGVEQVM